MTQISEIPAETKQDWGDGVRETRISVTPETLRTSDRRRPFSVGMRSICADLVNLRTWPPTFQTHTR